MLAAQDWILGVNSTRELPALMDLLAQPLVLLLQARTTVVFPWDPTTQALGSVLGYGLPEETPPLVTLRTSSLSTTVLAADRLLEVADLDVVEGNAEPDYSPARALGWRALAAVPLVARGERVGLLYVGWDAPHPLDDRERLLLSLLAQHAAVALENARLQAENAARAEALRQADRQRMEARLEGVTLAARELADRLGNKLTPAVGVLQLLQDEPALPSHLSHLMQESAALLASATQDVTMLQQVARVETKDTAFGPALDLERSSESQNS